jgi:alpha-D-xyloside xylohydrolase
MRGLVMDFPSDPKVRDLNDEYLYGPAFLVSPVHVYKARSRPVYLPAGTGWYDFYSGRAYSGGQTIEADAPLAKMPLFVKAGSIVPTGPDIQWVGEKPDAPVTLFVYTGADGSFELYEDDGLSNAYQRGAVSRIPLRWNEKAGVLTIGERDGAFEGMRAKRTFNIRWISGPRPDAADFNAKPDATVAYNGAAVTVRK